MPTQISSVEELRRFAEEFLKARPKGTQIGLVGELGAGKTTFVRCCLEILARKANLPTPKVISPTFVFHQRYHVGVGVEHFDLYRFENATEKELIEIGYFDAMERSEGGFVFVEWPEKSDSKTLQLSESLELRVLSPTERQITLTRI